MLQKFTINLPAYNLNKIFENVENYIGKKGGINTLKSSASSSISNPYTKFFKVHLPFDINKFLRISKDNIVLKDGAFTATADLVLFNSSKSYILNSKEMYNLLAINDSKSTKLDFKQVLSKNSAVASSRLLNFSKIKKISKTNLIEDYKITNSIVEINDVITKLPQDVVPQPKLSDDKRQIDDELYRNISHVINQTLNEYQQVNNNNNDINYYYEIASFNAQNLKNIDWRPLTDKSFTGLKRQDKVFCRLMPKILDLKVQSNIFDFSYNMNEIKTVGEMISYVS